MSTSKNEQLPQDESSSKEPLVVRHQTMKHADSTLSIGQMPSLQDSPIPTSSAQTPKVIGDSDSPTSMPPIKETARDAHPRLTKAVKNFKSRFQPKKPEDEVAKLQRQYSEYRMLLDGKSAMSKADETPTRSVGKRFTLKSLKRRIQGRKNNLIGKLSDKFHDLKVEEISALHVKTLQSQVLKRLNALALKLKKGSFDDVKLHKNNNVTGLMTADLSDPGDKKDSLEVVKAVLGKSQLFKDDQVLLLGPEDKADCDAILKLYEQIEDTKKEAAVLQETAKLMADLKQPAESESIVHKDEDRKPSKQEKPSRFKGMFNRTKGNNSSEKEEKELQEQYSKFMDLSWQERKKADSTESHEKDKGSRGKNLKGYFKKLTQPMKNFKGILVDKLSKKFKKIDKIDLSTLHVQKLQTRVLDRLNRLALKLTGETSDAKSPKGNLVGLTAADLKDVDFSDKESHKVVETLLRKSGTLKSIDLSSLTDADGKDDCDSIADLFHQIQATKETAEKLRAEARKEADGKIQDEIEGIQIEYSQYMKSMEGKSADSPDPSDAHKKSDKENKAKGGEQNKKVGENNEKWPRLKKFKGKLKAKLSRKFEKFGRDFDVDLAALHVEELKSGIVDKLNSLVLKLPGVNPDKKQTHNSSLGPITIDDLETAQEFASIDDIKDFISKRTGSQISSDQLGQLSAGENKQLCDSIVGLFEQIEISKKTAEDLSSGARVLYKQRTMKILELSPSDTKPEFTSTGTVISPPDLGNDPIGTSQKKAAELNSGARHLYTQPTMKVLEPSPSDTKLSSGAVSNRPDPRDDPQSFASFKYDKTLAVAKNLPPKERKREEAGPSQPQPVQRAMERPVPTPVKARVSEMPNPNGERPTSDPKDSPVRRTPKSQNSIAAPTSLNDQVMIFANRAYDIHILTQKINQLSASANRHRLPEAERGELKSKDVAKLEEAKQAKVAECFRLGEERRLQIVERDAALKALGNLNTKYLQKDNNSLHKVIQIGNQRKLEKALHDLTGQQIHITNRHLLMMKRGIETSRSQGPTAAVAYFLKNLSSSITLNKPATEAARREREKKCQLIISMFEQIQYNKKIVENLKGEIKKQKLKLEAKKTDKKSAAKPKETQQRYYKYMPIPAPRKTRDVDVSPKTSSTQSMHPSLFTRLSSCFFRASPPVTDSKRVHAPSPSKTSPEVADRSGRVESTGKASDSKPLNSKSRWDQFASFLFGKPSPQTTKAPKVPETSAPIATPVLRESTMKGF